MKKRCLAVIITLSCVFYTGIYIGQNTVDPEVVVQLQYIDRVVERVTELEVVKEVPAPMDVREFENLQELKDWLASDDLNIHPVLRADREGMIDLNGPCDYIALELQRRALAQGYLMSTEIVQEGSGLHMLNSAVIGNDIYFIEPQTDEVWLAAYRN